MKNYYYGGICLQTKKTYFSSSWIYFKEKLFNNSESFIHKKGKKEEIEDWIFYCKNSIFIIENENNIGELKNMNNIYCDAGTKNKELEVRITNFNSISLLNLLLCNNEFNTCGNFVLDKLNYSVNHAELTGIFFSLLLHEKQRKASFIFSDSAICVFYWLYGTYSSSTNEKTIELIKKTIELKNKLNIKIFYINRKLNKADISLGNKIIN